MKKMYYKILNQTLCFSDGFTIPNVLRKYEDRGSTTYDILLSCQCNEIFSTVYGIHYLPTNSVNHIFFSQKDPCQFLCISKEDYSKLYFGLQKDCPEESFMELFMTGFYSFVSKKQTLLMHASAVSYKGNGIIFTAPSGTGKTTQAELWRRYRNATILNGDKVFLKQELDGIYAWGSPWRGSSIYHENQNVKLKAIIVLEQSSENSITKLDDLELLEKVVPHVFFHNEMKYVSKLFGSFWIKF